MNDVAVKVTNLSKGFKIYSSPWGRALEWASFGRKICHQDFWALKGISFEVGKGECLGIIGPNGAGKSTLLKILTRSLYPTTGTFEIRGNVLSLLELGTGFNPELTGRQNIYRSSQLLGFPEGYVSERIQDIQEFAELGDFFDRPIKTYSSGMFVRLAFSMFVFLKPEVLIVDEALSVGDIFFQQKCFAKMREMLSSDTTCLFASHDTAAVQRLCHQAILLEHGEINFKGAAEETVSRYYANLGGRTTTSATRVRPERPTWVDDHETNFLPPDEILSHNILGTATSRHGPRDLEIVAACVQNKKGIFTAQVTMLESLAFHLLLRANGDIVNPSAGIRLTDRFGNVVFAAGTWNLNHRLPDLSPGQELIVRFDLGLTVQPGTYVFTLGCAEPAEEDKGLNVGFSLDRYEMAGRIDVTADYNSILPFYGIAQLPMKAKSLLVGKRHS